MQFTIQIVRDALGAELAQQQLSHANLATTEAHYFQRRTPAPTCEMVWTIRNTPRLPTPLLRGVGVAALVHG
jgi:hypothetical protein